ncbi:MAG TPA: esterase, partial [Burkholderiales bacterium]|nr:esterase [Burkholderiales bacterium]
MSARSAVVALLLAGCATPAPIALRDMGSFHVGGREVTISGKPVKQVVFTPGGVPAKIDPNGTYVVESMYVQYFLPANRRGSVPLLMWHGGGLTGVTYETTPDGREGWLNWFVKRGWDVYDSDAVERGRAGWAMYPEIFKSEPLFLPKSDPYVRFRMAGSEFPVASYDNFMRQVVPRWTTTDDATIAAYTALVDRVCPCVLLFHSQAGQFGFRVAQARPDKVKALIAVEPAGQGDPRQVDRLKAIPTLF